jgi:uncharacterized membrane protein
VEAVETIEVDVPVRTAYNQWTQFEEFPQFMHGVESVRQLDDTHLHWKADIMGVHREWDATIVEQRPDDHITWRSTDGTDNAGTVWFRPLAPDRTEVKLALTFDPEGFVESAGETLGFVQRRVENDLEKFKDMIEERGRETGAWRGQVPDDPRLS